MHALQYANVFRGQGVTTFSARKISVFKADFYVHCILRRQICKTGWNLIPDMLLLD